MNKRRLGFRVVFVAVLLAVAAVMLVIGRGHTVYFDNKTLEWNGETYAAPYRVVVYVKGESVAKLKARERGMTTNIGQNLGFALGITQEKGDEERIIECGMTLPYGMDGVILNLPGYLAGLPQEAYVSEFVAVPSAADLEEEAPSEEDALMADAEL